jgi:hypothetical protein
LARFRGVSGCFCSNQSNSGRSDGLTLGRISDFAAAIESSGSPSRGAVARQVDRRVIGGCPPLLAWPLPCGLWVGEMAYNSSR